MTRQLGAAPSEGCALAGAKGILAVQTTRTAIKCCPRMRSPLLLASVAAWILVHPGLCRGADQGGVQFFETKIRPVLATRCFGCHSAQAPKLQGGLSLDSQSGIRKGGNSGTAVESGQPERILLPRAIRYQAKEVEMP